eukprot:2220830-Rhodomonas_salina.1
MQRRRATVRRVRRASSQLPHAGSVPSSIPCHCPMSVPDLLQFLLLSSKVTCTMPCSGQYRQGCGT